MQYVHLFGATDKKINLKHAWLTHRPLKLKPRQSLYILPFLLLSR